MPKIITANDLRSGAVVYLSETGEWVSTFSHAGVAAAPDDAKRLETLARSAVESNKVTAVYAFDVRLAPSGPEPISVRERIRALHSDAA